MTRALALLTLICIASCVQEVPPAMQHETAHSRAVAAGQWEHQAGYGDYAAFVETNP